MMFETLFLFMGVWQLAEGRYWAALFVFLGVVSQLLWNAY
jgi:hypothetical protein